MTYIDSAILDATEWFCRRLQVLTGRTNVWLAIQFTNLSIIVYFVWAAGVFLWVGDAGVRIALGLFCAGVLYALTQTVFKVSIEAYEKSAYHRVAKGLRNPRRVRDALLRIPFLTLSLVLFYPTRFIYIHQIEWALPRTGVHIAMLSYSLVVLTTVVLYLLACDPLPPCSSKVRAWLRGMSPARLPASESAGGRGETRLRHTAPRANRLARRRPRASVRAFAEARADAAFDRRIPAFGTGLPLDKSQDTATEQCRRLT